MSDEPNREIQQEVLDAEKARHRDWSFDKWLDECPPYEGPIRYQVSHKGAELIVQVGAIDEDEDWVLINMGVYDPLWRSSEQQRDEGVGASWKVFRDGHIEE